MDGTDEEGSSTDEDEEADGMVLDEGDIGYPGQEGTKYSDLSDDQASLSFGNSDGETDVDSVMMVSLACLLFMHQCDFSALLTYQH